MPGVPTQQHHTTPQRSLPTLDKLQAKLPDNLDAREIAASWFKELSDAVESKDIDKVLSLFLDEGLWRDMLALTWEFRTFEGKQRIQTFLQDQLGSSGFGNLQIKPDTVELQQLYPDLAWIQGIYTFETAVGKGSGVFRLVPTSTGRWLAYILYTNLEELKGFPEQIGANRNFKPNHGMWPAQRHREINFEGSEPIVVIIGAGQSGLEAAARLKLLGVSSLIIDKAARVGDQWRGRYEALCLHDPVCEFKHCFRLQTLISIIGYDHMPYIPYGSGYMNILRNAEAS